jgi:hypothetical protein
MVQLRNRKNPTYSDSPRSHFSVVLGSAQIAATAAVDGLATFHLIPGEQEL